MGVATTLGTGAAFGAGGGAVSQVCVRKLKVKRILTPLPSAVAGVLSPPPSKSVVSVARLAIKYNTPSG